MSNLSTDTKMQPTPELKSNLSEADLEYLANAMAVVPERYRDFALGRMQPTAQVNLPLERQAQVLAALRQNLHAHPDKSVIFYGPAGTGKTALMAACFRLMAVRQTLQHKRNGDPRDLYWMDIGQWSEDMVAFNFGKEKLPPYLPGRGKMTVETVNRLHWQKPLFAFDEFDKVRSQEQTMKVVNDLIRAVYNKNAQTFVTTNLTPEEFVSRFSDHVGRRVKDDDNVITVNLFK